MLCAVRFVRFTLCLVVSVVDVSARVCLFLLLWSRRSFVFLRFLCVFRAVGAVFLCFFFFFLSSLSALLFVKFVIVSFVSEVIFRVSSARNASLSCICKSVTICIFVMFLLSCQHIRNASFYRNCYLLSSINAARCSMMRAAPARAGNRFRRGGGFTTVLTSHALPFNAVRRDERGESAVTSPRCCRRPPVAVRGESGVSGCPAPAARPSPELLTTP